MGDSRKAVQLVRPVSARHFEACSEGLAQIEALGPDARIKVLSIAGISRQGKSTLLELLAGKMGAFKIADGTDPCTEGIHMLITPLEKERNTYLVRTFRRLRSFVVDQVFSALQIISLILCRIHNERLGCLLRSVHSVQVLSLITRLQS